MVRRIADWLEKMSVASLAVGIFQDSTPGLFVGVVCLAISLCLTKITKMED